MHQETYFLQKFFEIAKFKRMCFSLWRNSMFLALIFDSNSVYGRQSIEDKDKCPNFSLLATN